MKGVIMTVAFSPEMDQVYIRTGNANLTFVRNVPSYFKATIRFLSMLALWFTSVFAYELVY
jgi:hypothetical protein